MKNWDEQKILRNEANKIRLKEEILRRKEFPVHGFASSCVDLENRWLPRTTEAEGGESCVSEFSLSTTVKRNRSFNRASVCVYASFFLVL